MTFVTQHDSDLVVEGPLAKVGPLVAGGPSDLPPMAMIDPGVQLSAFEISATIDSIASVQLADGNIPWTPGGHTDAWNLVEAAMALDLDGRFEEATRAYEWLSSMQRQDGSWHQYYMGNDVEDRILDTNVICYVAVGVWHHYLCTRDAAFLASFWPMVEGALDFALELQKPHGEIIWARHVEDMPWDQGLLTGSSSIHASLRCGIAIAEHLGHERPDWELSLGSLAHAIAHRESVEAAFMPKHRWAMDWYYPILGGVLRGKVARDRIESGWANFVVPGRGVRCVADRPWVTAAETCELVMALDAIGMTEEAHALFAWVQFLRADSGGYWTGANFEDEQWEGEGVIFPPEQPTWNSAAVVLANEALFGTGPTAGLFRGERLPTGVAPDAEVNLP